MTTHSETTCTECGNCGAGNYRKDCGRLNGDSGDKDSAGACTPCPLYHFKTGTGTEACDACVTPHAANWTGEHTGKYLVGNTLTPTFTTLDDAQAACDAAPGCGGVMKTGADYEMRAGTTLLGCLSGMPCDESDASWVGCPCSFGVPKAEHSIKAHSKLSLQAAAVRTTHRATLAAAMRSAAQSAECAVRASIARGAATQNWRARGGARRARWGSTRRLATRAWHAQIARAALPASTALRAALCTRRA